MRRRFEHDVREARLVRFLREEGPSNSERLQHLLGISQPTFSRLITKLGGGVQRFGRGPATRYAVPRTIPGVDTPVPVFEIRQAPHAPRFLVKLQPVEPRGFVSIQVDSSRWEYHQGLPWYLHDLWPRGFLGRQTPRRHPALGLPDDIRVWDDSHLLLYLTSAGWDLPGAFIVGDAAFGRFMRQDETSLGVLRTDERHLRYPEFANESLTHGEPGSSAAGEQPKFLAVRAEDDRQIPVLVKYSPAGDDPVARRIASLLIAEQLALETLSDAGIPVAKSSLIHAAGRVFLESERFDRDGRRYRHGACSLDALDGEFLGSDRTSWSKASRRLAERGIIPTDSMARIHLVERFGQLIGNTDRHFGNLSFYLDGTKVTGLAPIYDMLPMHYAPRGGGTDTFFWPHLRGK